MTVHELARLLVRHPDALAALADVVDTALCVVDHQPHRHPTQVADRLHAAAAAVCEALDDAHIQETA